ncbi:hypothetical protein FKM82_030112, partial [Ascaphus truei]
SSSSSSSSSVITSFPLRLPRLPKSRRRFKTEPKTEEESEEEMLMMMMMTEEEEEEDDDEGASSDICIVKVESGAGGAKGGRGRGKGGEEEKSLGPDAEESLVNSTVEGTEDGVGQDGEARVEQGGVVKAIYSEDVEGGEGLLIIPSSYHEEEEESSVVMGGGGRCQSSVVVGGGGVARSIGGAGNQTGSLGVADARHGVGRAVRCCKCEEVFQGVEKLVFHMRAQHFVFMCPRCGKQFNHSSNLNRHMNVHRGVKSHACQICGKCFTQKSTLHDHLNLHSGERPYRCSYCDVRFAHKPAIRRHLKEQHGKTTAENVMEAGVAEINMLMVG